MLTAYRTPHCFGWTEHASLTECFPNFTDMGEESTVPAGSQEKFPDVGTIPTSTQTP